MTRSHNASEQYFGATTPGVFDNDHDLENYQQLQESQKEFDDASNDILIGMGNSPESDAQLLVQYRRIADRHLQAIRQCASNHQQSINASAEATREAALSGQQAQYSLAAIAIVSMGGAVFYFARTIATPLQRLQRSIAKIHEGMFEIDMPTMDEDEIAALAMDIRYMARQLRRAERNKVRSSQVFLAEEREQRRIAEGLHVNVSQRLAICKMRVEALAERIHDVDDEAALEDIAQTLMVTLREIAALTFDISPPPLFDLGLEAGLEWLAMKFKEKYELPCQVDKANESVDLNEEIRVVLFHAVRELLQNVVKHADAQEVLIQLHSTNGELEVSVRDDGVGFRHSPDESDSLRYGYGLHNIRNRVGLVGGKIDIKSEQGRGTTVRLSVPIKVADHEN